jgi:hypothetical protein
VIVVRVADGLASRYRPAACSLYGSAVVEELPRMREMHIRAIPPGPGPVLGADEHTV